MSGNALAEQEPHKRIKNFTEVIVGLKKRQAVEAAKHFLDRKEGARGEGCPLGTDIFRALERLSKGDIYGAYLKVKESNVLPAVTGRLSQEPYPQMKIYNKSGDLISLRSLERFVADACLGKPILEAPELIRKEKIAVIGSGPSSLALSAECAYRGYKVDVFEKLHELGGVLRWGIPEFRLPKNILDAEIEYIRSLGVNFYPNTLIGKNYSLEELFNQNYSAVFLGLGADIQRRLNIPGEDSYGVIYADDFLKQINLMKAYEFPKYHTSVSLGQKVLVIGGGNAAVDAARVVRRLGSDVTMVLRSTEDDMRVRPYIRQHAKQEGVRIESLINPSKIIKNENNCVVGLECRKLDYADETGNEEWTLQEVEGSDFMIEADTIIVAIGHKPDIRLPEAEGIRTLKNGNVSLRKSSHMTSMKGVFVGGALADGAGSVLQSMVSAKKVVDEIQDYLQK